MTATVIETTEAMVIEVPLGKAKRARARKVTNRHQNTGGPGAWEEATAEYTAQKEAAVAVEEAMTEEAKAAALVEAARMERCVRALRLLYRELAKLESSHLEEIAAAATACRTLVADAGWCAVEAVKAAKEKGK